MSGSRSETPSTLSIEQRTFNLDRVRFVFQGIIDGIFKNYFQLVAIRVFHMAYNTKGLLSAAGYIGMALSPVTLWLFSNRTIPLTTNRVIALLLAIVCVSTFCSAFTGNWVLFLICAVISRVLYKQTLPFVTDIYNRNYPRKRRGRIIGKLFMILALATVASGYIFGKLLDYDLQNYRWISIVGGLSLGACVILFLKMPNGHVLQRDSRSFFRSNLSILFNDRLFSTVLVLWSLVSIAFQMTYPLRAEYLANQQFGLNLSNADITLLIVTLPTLTRILSAMFWGKIFDTSHFAIMKLMINTAFLLSIPLFFFAKSFYLMALSSIFLGLGYSGNLTAWQLWVTKVAPSPEKLSAYVSLDVVIMGLRDAFSAWLGYRLLAHEVQLNTICIIAMLLITISLFGFCFLTSNKRLR